MSDLIDRHKLVSKINDFAYSIGLGGMEAVVVGIIKGQLAVESERTAHPTCETCGHAKPHPTRLETMRICFVNSATQWHKDDYCSHHTEVQK